jgi:hypothetical protein
VPILDTDHSNLWIFITLKVGSSQEEQVGALLSGSLPLEELSFLPESQGPRSPTELNVYHDVMTLFPNFNDDVPFIPRFMSRKFSWKREISSSLLT